MHLKTWFVASLLVGSCAAFPAETQPAQCKAIWIISIPCVDVHVALVNQIKLWSSPDTCSTGGEKCLYELKATNQTHIFAKHTTATDRHVDDLMFLLKPSRDSLTCRVVGVSTSEVAGKTGDNGTNYCNLFNLVDGSELTNAHFFREVTNDFMCMERSFAKCEIY